MMLKIQLFVKNNI